MAVTPPSSKITPLTQSGLNYMLPVNKQDEKQKIYEFNGHYYLNRENAKEDLIKAIYQRPEKYGQNKKLYVSIMSKDDVWKLPTEIAEATICGSTSEDKGCISSKQYSEELTAEKDKFVNHVFDQVYKGKEKIFYLDGFNNKGETNYFETKQEAIASLEEKLAQVKFNPKYRYVTNAGKKMTFDSKKATLDYIHNNEVVE